MSNRNNVFIYWDNSNIFISAKRAAVESEGTHAQHRVRIDFHNMLKLAHADRTIKRAFAAGSVPPELRHVWNRMENEGLDVHLSERGETGHREVNVDQVLQLTMVCDALDFNGDPGIAVLLTGDGEGFEIGKGFHANLERMYKKGWRIEVLSWRHSCKRAMREWAQSHGEQTQFIALDDFYESVTFLEQPAPGHPHALPRDAVPIDLSKRTMAK